MFIINGGVTMEPAACPLPGHIPRRQMAACQHMDTRHCIPFTEGAETKIKCQHLQGLPTMFRPYPETIFKSYYYLSIYFASSSVGVHKFIKM